MRAQTSLPALGLAFLVFTGVVVVGVVVADGAVLSADRSALDRQAAVALSDRLVAADAPLTDRANVVNGTAIEEMNGTRLRARYGLAPGADAAVALDDRTVAKTGPVDGGYTVERLVVVREVHRRTLTPSFVAGNRVTLPRRTGRARLAIDPPQNTTVTVVRAGQRVVLANDSGLRGRFSVDLARYRTTEFVFEATDQLSEGNVTITYYPVETRKARLEVTVDG